jgi:serpin B
MRKPIIILCLLATVSCNKGLVDKTPGNATNTKSLVLSPAQQQIANAGNGFTFKLLNRLFSLGFNGSNTPCNGLLSPLSISMALSMSANGANGPTLDSIMQTLDLQAYNLSQVNTLNQTLVTGLPQLDPSTSMKIANSLWYKNTFTPLPAFLKTDSAYYQATVQALDFTTASAPQTINNWVNLQTNGKITNIVGAIPASTVMYLINTVYFKGAWTQSFNTANTTTATFSPATGGPVQASFMNGNQTFNTTNTADGSTVAELPYGNGKYSMVLLMPQEGVSLAQYAAPLDSSKWGALTASLKPTTAQLTLPKFTFSYAVDLTSILSTIGMSIAFSNQADFSRINADGGLTISDILHKTYIAVDETGTEAAAATSVGITATAVVANRYVFNRPFLFFIRETDTNLIVFAGVLNNPLLTGN